MKVRDKEITRGVKSQVGGRVETGGEGALDSSGCDFDDRADASGSVRDKQIARAVKGQAPRERQPGGEDTGGPSRGNFYNPVAEKVRVVEVPRAAKLLIGTEAAARPAMTAREMKESCVFHAVHILESCFWRSEVCRNLLMPGQGHTSRRQCRKVVICDYSQPYSPSTWRASFAPADEALPEILAIGFIMRVRDA